jgi:hypothetical protein
MVKRFRPGAEVAFLPRPALQISSGKLLEAIFTPRCPLLAENFRRALELAVEVDPELETREYQLHTLEEASAFPGEGLFLNGIPLSHTFLDLERWPDDLRACLQPPAQEAEIVPPQADAPEHPAGGCQVDADPSVDVGFEDAAKVSSPSPTGADEEQSASGPPAPEKGPEGAPESSAAPPDQPTNSMLQNTLPGAV